MATSLTFHSISTEVRLMFTSAVCAANTDRHCMSCPTTSRSIDSKNSSANSLITRNAPMRAALGHSGSRADTAVSSVLSCALIALKCSGSAAAPSAEVEGGAGVSVLRALCGVLLIAVMEAGTRRRRSKMAVQPLDSPAPAPAPAGNPASPPTSYKREGKEMHRRGIILIYGYYLTMNSIDDYTVLEASSSSSTSYYSRTSVLCLCLTCSSSSRPDMMSVRTSS